MKRLMALSLALAALPAGLQTAYGAAAGVGFSMNGNFYNPSDSRYQGVGTGVGINIKFDDSLSLGYRVEELNVRYDQAVAGVAANANFNVVTQGITGYYRTWGSERLGIDFGLWMGAATAGDFQEGAGAFGVTSPFVEPIGRVVYSSAGKVEAQLSLSIGYRFMRQFNLAEPSLTHGAGVEGALRNFDGLDISIGIGVQF